MLRKTALLFLVALFSVSLVFAAGDAEQEGAEDEYPSQPIRLVVPYGAGGGTDTHARLIVRALEDILPVPVVVVNMGGGASAIGSREVLEADPDGYTVLINIVNIWTNQALGNTDFGPFDLTPVAEAGTFYLVETTAGDSEWNSFSEIAEAIREEPGSVRIATNIGAITHFTSLGVQQEIGGGAEFNMVHIGDGSQRIASVLGGNVDLTIMGTNEAAPYHESGEMKVLAVYAPERVEGMPDVPTAREQGVDYVQPVSYWFFTPPETPDHIVEYLADALEEAMQSQRVLDRLEELTMLPTFKRGEELDEAIEAQGERLFNLADVYDLGG
jgi:tripartite-type tricarboxylate transporter receptor subunit TctC